MTLTELYECLPISELYGECQDDRVSVDGVKYACPTSTTAMYTTALLSDSYY